MNSKIFDQSALHSLARYGNVILVSTVGLVLAMMIIPLPPLVLDLLLAVNMGGSITLLLVAISVTDALKISAFPTLLLVATLFRLGLNISSTRLILADGYAGHVIQTFGYFATSGNLVVGCLLFLILTLIQFLVIAKGAERVAEVAARFTLDALPGKQMSIDADLRAGLISQSEAKNQRDQLHRESKLYGAMDGAMKFVKGDAIAGLVITCVNLFGGFFIGAFQRGLSLPGAIQTYSLLTIGDGLVSQIPSLLVAMTAGFVVTRVADEKSGHSLGTDIGMQIFSQPKALFQAALLCFLMGFIPGFPMPLFLLVSCMLSGFGALILWQYKKKAGEMTSLSNWVTTPEKQMSENGGLVHPLLLEVGPELYRVFQTDSRWTTCFYQLYPKLKLYLSHELGVTFPDLKLSVQPFLKNSFRYVVRIYDIPIDSGNLNPQYLALLNSTIPANFSPPHLTTETFHGTKISLWGMHQKKLFDEAGLATYGPEELLLRDFAKILKKNAAEFLGIQETRLLLNTVETQYPELVREVVPKMMSLQKLNDILKRLVEEGIPIRDMRLVLQTLSTLQPETKDTVTLTEQVRIGLKRTLCHLYVPDGNKLPALLLDPEIENEIRQGIQKNGMECYLALPPNRLADILSAVRETVSPLMASAFSFVMLTQMDIRRYVKKIIEEDFYNLPVLSFQELDAKIIIEPRGTVSFQPFLNDGVAQMGN